MKFLHKFAALFVLCLLLGYASIILHAPIMQVQANNPYPNWAGDFSCGSLGKVKIYAAESPACDSGSLPYSSLNKYQATFVLAPETNPQAANGTYTVKTSLSKNFCPGGDSPCITSSGLHPVYQQGSISMNNGTATSMRVTGSFGDSVPNFCGSYQYDLAFQVWQNGRMLCQWGDMNNPASGGYVGPNGVKLANAYWASCAAKDSSGHIKVCTNPTPTSGITPTVTTPPPHLIVKKHVINDNGGTKNAHDFTIFVKNMYTGQILSQSFGSETGTSITLSPNTPYVVSEGTHTSYTNSFSGDCSTIIYAGQTKYCTVTNNDIPGITPTPTVTVIPSPSPSVPHLIVFKHVVSDGSVVASDFTIHVTGTNVSATSFQGDENGTDVTLDAGDYTVTEDQHDGFTLTGRSADCTGYIAAGQTKTCYLVNSQNGITPTPTTTNTNNCNNTDQSNNNGGNNNNNCNQQEQHQEQNQYNNNNQTVNITYAGGQQQQQVLGVSYPINTSSLPNTGPAETWELLGALAPLGFILRKISGK